MAYPDELRDALLGRIRSTDRQKLSLKIKSLLREFGFQTNYRVRQSSLQEALDQLERWGIAHHLPHGTTADDFVTLWVRDVDPGVSRPAERTPRSDEAGTAELELDMDFSPLAFLFAFNDAVMDESRSTALCEDVMAALWSFRPVCLFVEAEDEYFGFVGAFLGALMRRRALMVRRRDWGDPIPAAVEILTLDRLKRITGKRDVDDWPPPFPTEGAVYLIRDLPEEPLDAELAATVREVFVPHTYRLKGRYGSESDREYPSSVVTHQPEFSRVTEWMAAFAGSLRLGSDELVELSSLMTEASRLRDTLLDRETYRGTLEGFRSGFESTEHMVLKNAVLRHLRDTHPEEKIEVEQVVADVDSEEGDPDVTADLPRDERRKDKPDLRIDGRLWVEVETLRAVTLRGSNPFFALEAKLRAKLDNMRRDPEVWLVIPSDVAMLAGREACGLANHLAGEGDGRPRVRVAFFDLQQGRPVFLRSKAPVEVEIKIRGGSWRETGKSGVERPLTWDDVAGYSDVKQHLTREVLDPLRRPERYAKHGMAVANGLLLLGGHPKPASRGHLKTGQ